MCSAKNSFSDVFFLNFFVATSVSGSVDLLKKLKWTSNEFEANYGIKNPQFIFLNESTHMGTPAQCTP